MTKKKLSEIITAEAEAVVGMINTGQLKGFVPMLAMIMTDKSGKEVKGVVPDIDPQNKFSSGFDAKLETLFRSGYMIGKQIPENKLIAITLMTEAWFTKETKTEDIDKKLKKYGSVGKMPNKSECVMVATLTNDKKTATALLEVVRDKKNVMTLVKDKPEINVGGASMDMLEAFYGGFEKGQENA